MRTARTLIFGVVLALVVGLTACTKASHKPESVAATQLPSEVATKIEVSLSKDDKASRSLVLAPELRQAYIDDKAQGFPAGTAVKIDHQTFIAEGDYGVVEADISGQGRYFLYLLRRNGEWQVFDMRSKVASPSAAGIKPVAFTRHETELEGCSSGFDKRAPVLFVHGLNASATMWDKPDTVYQSIKAIPGMFLETFDYENEHSLWVDHPNIGPKLARRIACLANESRKAGGPGKVIVVAHSMGGLATRFAADQTNEFTGKKVSEDLGLVVTIGTPHKGTPVAELTSAAIHVFCFAGLPFSGGTLENCKKHQSAIFAMQAFMSSGKVDELPVLPPQVPCWGLLVTPILSFSLWVCL